MNLETRHAQAIISLLEDAQDVGLSYVVFEIRQEMALQPHQLDFFDTLGAALDHWEAKAGFGYLPGVEEYPVYYRHTDQLLEEIKQANLLTINKHEMNLNNLEDLKKEVKDLGFNPKVADELEKNMRQLPGYFTLKDQFPGDKGLVDMTLHFRKSGQSDFYNFNKFDATAGKVPPTIDNQHYMVLTENKENKEKPLVKAFDSPNEAIEFFKKQKGTSELALGESPESKQMLASKEDGKVNYINKDFRSAYFSPAIKQTFYLKEGNGFTARQAANMVQGRTVYRDNMLSSLGEPYKAWIRLDFDQKKDDYGNYKLKQFHHPTYGFDLGKTLSDYRIKEMADPAKKEGIMEAMRHGDRVQVTALDKENKEVKVLTEAVPRYGKLDFYNEAGIRQRREQFEKPAMAMDLSQGKGQGKTKEKEQEESKSMSVR
ncbi:hypothetical protein [Mucilaginibacter sp. L3T2-6]|uniref:hypothetical protein n=1 Tax=Mucilaginibacter sp. L3T2-6 TaxID=3062491 RepID=UPI002675AB1A|nr:hypothetical protein [Mucilaginibacter sp. L3T2-6]MDO3641512.1 hypothetical protein [Mucilaginibacter sp. L3T2-6]MDV6213727.1 hypothetical protein [Mucilaginibacter sp. L3T2-6]